MKFSLCSTGSGTRWLLALSSMLAVPQIVGAGVFTVTTINDTHAINPGTSASDGNGQVSLRSAVEAANAQGGTNMINLPAGMFNLTLGEIELANQGGLTTTITGASAATTVISQTDPTNRVFNVDANSAGATFTTMANLTIQSGHDGSDHLGGAGILAGSILSLPKDVLKLSHCLVQDNHCQTNTTREPGGGVQMAGGDLNISDCTFSNNTSGQSFGGGVFLLAQSVISSLQVSNSIFANNGLTNNSGSAPDGGGAIMIETPAGSVHTMAGCLFTNNQVVGASGIACGGGIQINGGTLNITTSTFVTNNAVGPGSFGGAIYADAGQVNLSFCRLTGNSATDGGSAIYNHGANGAVTTALNDWWGCNGGPGALGCDLASGDGGNLTFTPWLVVSNSANPNAITAGQSTTLTVSMLQNSAGQMLTASQVSVMTGVTVFWNGTYAGNLSSHQTTIQANGQATATFASDNSGNSGLASATLDNAIVTAYITVASPDLALGLTDDRSGSLSLGGNWTWTLHVTNSGAAPATFTNGNVVVVDNLPVGGVTYGTPVLANVNGVTGSLVPAIDDGTNLLLAAAGTVTLNVGGSFDLQITATPTALGYYSNPRLGGECQVNPFNNLPEASTLNNYANDSVQVTCPAITATVSGDSSICSGGQGVVVVTVSGGKPPYSVTLGNGGGTQTGSSPLFFNVSPSDQTTYAFNYGNDADGCSLTGNGAATISLTPPLTQTVITLPEPSVLANSAGNQAFAPPGMDRYAWTINNGLILGPANQQMVTFATGNSNLVQLSVMVFNGCGMSASNSVNVPLIAGFSVHTNVTFANVLGFTNTSLAFDGTNFWAAGDNGGVGYSFAQYSLSGLSWDTYAPGLAIRSLTTLPDGNLLAFVTNNGVIYQQTSPGVFVDTGVQLTGTLPAPDAQIVLNASATEFVSLSGGNVSRWSTNGTLLGSVPLAGYGTVPGETNSPQNHRLAAMDNFWLTYNGAGVLSVWDARGTRVTQLDLPGAGTNPADSSGFSFCNHRVFLPDSTSQTWRGYDLYSRATVAVLAAENNQFYCADVTNKIAGVGSLPRVDLIHVDVPAPVPSLAQLRNYQAVLVFSDYYLTDSYGLGNVLADYIDQGGGLVENAYAFSYGANFGLQGRVNFAGYLPFNMSDATYVAGSTLFKDLPEDPLLDGVNTFKTAALPVLHTPITLTYGATQVAELNNGIPLVATKAAGSRRTVGLNFYPPSSDVFDNGWDHTTDGAQLMVNALLWSGRIPPTILTGPAGGVVAQGDTVNFSVAATGTSDLTYQWRFNGTNLPDATNAVFSLNYQPGAAGAYSVVVSNRYGTTTSLNAVLNPQLRFQAPVPTGDAFSLYLENIDGTPVTTNRAARVNLYTSSNLALPSAQWTLLPNPVVPSGSVLRADGFSTTNKTAQYFRAVEAP